MTKKQTYTAPKAEVFVVQSEGALCVVSPNTLNGIILAAEVEDWGDL